MLLESIANLYFEISLSISDQRLITKSFADRNAVSMGNRFPNLSSISLHRPIRLNSESFPFIKQIQIDLNNIRPKEYVHLFLLIFSNEFHCLSSFHI